MDKRTTSLRIEQATKDLLEACETKTLTQDQKLRLLCNFWLNRQRIIDLTEEVAVQFKLLIPSSINENNKTLWKNSGHKMQELLLEIQETVTNPKSPTGKPSFLERSFGEIMREVTKNKKEKENE